ncbi:hypothetical protein TWF694_004687 [Orbilia ellipsospora]|uniref:C2H2-type domain-containing protein n=1 Tax=Orbilia ellipsospora TaxID=2528407 RepID=A0AAV9WXA6_9PEZI
MSIPLVYEDPVGVFYYSCIEPGCDKVHNITLQDYTAGTFSQNEINHLIRINTSFRCPDHEPALTRSHIAIQWEVPEGTLLSKSLELSAVADTVILCPLKECGLTFDKPTLYKRHIAQLFRPFYCLRGSCCTNGVPSRSGFSRIEEVIRHLKKDSSLHEAVQGRPVDGWDFRRKTSDETKAVFDTLEFISEDELYAWYGMEVQRVH